MQQTLVRFVLVLILFIGSAGAQSAADSAARSDSEIRRILAERIDAFRQGVGIVAGVIEPNGRRVVAYGALDKNDPRPLNGDTIFEIGSATKVFTALLLADMVQRGEVALTDPIAKYLPPEVKTPQRAGHSITLQDLAMHTSGLPRIPSNFAPRDAANPYADYSVEQLYQALSSYELTRDIGSKYEYSNLGGGLLGHVLARRADTDYETLVRARICKPLGMNSTVIAPTPEMKGRFAVGHNATLAAVPNWDLPTLAGAGALRSTANDLLNFLAANLGYSESSLAPAMAAMVKDHRPTGTPGMEIALGWHVFPGDGNPIIWHNGGTGGYRSFLGYSPKSRVGVVVLSNTFTAAGVDDIGLHLLNSRAPLMKPPKEHKQVVVDPKLFDGYAGRYELAPNFVLSVTREGDHLFVQATGQTKFEIFAESERDYFGKIADIQMTFKTDDHGRATELVVHQNGTDRPARRIE